MGAAGLALLTIEGPRTLMVVADYLKKRFIEPLEEKRRLEAMAEGEARNQAAWEAWNERRMAAEASGEPFDDPPPGTVPENNK